jgi:tRNA threonylcarbamoyladenosine biosynthesis protein TsaB
MIILAFDTAMAACSAAVVSVECGEHQVLAAHHEARTRGHAEVLAPMIEKVMADAAVAFDGLDRIAVTTGPGTFTGVRIGVATARGIAVASGLPVIGVTTLEAVAAGAVKHCATRDRAIAAVFDARRGEVYVQCFSATFQALTKAKVLGYDDAWSEIEAYRPALAGSGAALIRPHSGSGRAGDASLPEQPTAAVVAELVAERDVGQAPVAPLYLRPPDAKLPA